MTNVPNNDIHTTVNEDIVRYAWLGQCGYSFKYMDKFIFIDPMLNDCLDEVGNSCRHYPSPIDAAQVACDFYFATHAHIDHLAPETAQKIYIMNSNCKFIVPSGVVEIARGLGIQSESIIGIKPGETITLSEGITVTAVSTAHPNHVYEDKPEMSVGYVLKLGSKTIIHTGDGYLTDELVDQLKEHKGADLLLPPINGRECEVTKGFIGNMDAKEAAELAIRIDAKLVIPTHFDMFIGNTADPEELVNIIKERAPQIEARVPKLLNLYEL